MHLLNNAISFVFALGVIIFVHEFGHLIVAKLFDTRVLTFSLGFGKRLWGFQRGETDYRVSLVPLGGYVRLGGELPDEVSEDPRDLVNKPRWQRVLIYLAGPAMNIVLALVLFAVVFMVGIQVPNLSAIEPVLGQVEPGSSAAAAGFEPGDRIVAVNGEKVESWQGVSFALMTSPGRSVEIEAVRKGKTFTAAVTPALIPRYDVGDTAGLFPQVFPQIIQVLSDSPAQRAGFRPGDELHAIDGRPIAGVAEFVDYLEKHPGKKIEVQILRKDHKETLTVVPEEKGGVGKIGASIGVYQRYGFARAFVESARENVEIVRQTFLVLGKIFTHQISAKGALAGPIEIAAQSGAAARAGFKYLLRLMGFVSTSIAILNLLPIPILDGGQISILLIESAMRRDLSLRIKEMISQVGFVLIVLLMLVVIYFDLSKNLPGLFSG